MIGWGHQFGILSDKKVFVLTISQLRLSMSMIYLILVEDSRWWWRYCQVTTGGNHSQRIFLTQDKILPTFHVLHFIFLLHYARAHWCAVNHSCTLPPPPSTTQAQAPPTKRALRVTELWEPRQIYQGMLLSLSLSPLPCAVVVLDVAARMPWN